MSGWDTWQDKEEYEYLSFRSSLWFFQEKIEGGVCAVILYKETSIQSSHTNIFSSSLLSKISRATTGMLYYLALLWLFFQWCHVHSRHFSWKKLSIHYYCPLNDWMNIENDVLSFSMKWCPSQSDIIIPSLTHPSLSLSLWYCCCQNMLMESLVHTSALLCSFCSSHVWHEEEKIAWQNKHNNNILSKSALICYVSVCSSLTEKKKRSAVTAIF